MYDKTMYILHYIIRSAKKPFFLALITALNSREIGNCAGKNVASDNNPAVVAAFYKIKIYRDGGTQEDA